MHRFEDESNKVYNYRIEVIEKIKVKYPDMKEKDYIRLSKIVSNIKFKECRYDKLTYNKIKNFI